MIDGNNNIKKKKKRFISSSSAQVASSKWLKNIIDINRNIIIVSPDIN